MSRFSKGAGLIAGAALLLVALGAQAAQKAAAPAAPAPAVAASPNDVARFIAGMPVAAESPLAKWTKEPGWQQHAKFFDDAYKALNERQISKIKAWGKQAIKQNQKTLYYLFSGPDYLYAEAFFPHAETYILAGLEPVGRVPEINERTRHGLPPIRASLHNTLNLSYFITSHMSSQLRTGELTGTLPILYLFIARAGKTITAAELINLDKDGNIVGGTPPAGSIQGAKIVFNDGPGAPQRTLYYFSTDLSEAGAKNTGFLKFSAKFGTGDGLVKSASYLLHNAGFATARNFLLQHVHTHVQDDTGIPYQFFDQKVWSLHPYGRYVGPIPIFQGHYQNQLNTLFIKEKAPAIDFGIGYRFRLNESNVLVAVKKVAPVTAAPAPAKPEPAAVAAPAPAPAPATPAQSEPTPASAPATAPAAPAEQKAETQPVQAPPAVAKDGQTETEKEKTAAAEAQKKSTETEPEKKSQ